MPQVGWIIDGKKYSHEKVMAMAKRYPKGWRYTPEMLDGMFQKHERDYPSPTTIAGCPREQVLKMQTRYYVEIDKAWAAFRGTTAHEVLRKAKKLEPTAIIERAIACEFDMGEEYPFTYWDPQSREQVTEMRRTVVLRGQPDKVVPEERLLVDYKTVKEIIDPADTKHYKLNGWRAQLSGYRWMLQQHGIEVDRALIMQWHPDHPEPIEVELWSLARTERHLRARLKKYEGVFDGTFDVTKDLLPPPLDFVTDKDQVWKCVTPGWCPVRDLCMDLQKKGV